MICSVGGDVLAVRPGGEGEVRLRRAHLHPDLRAGDLVEFAHERVTTIAVGVATCLFATVFVFPVWAGEDLRNLAAANLDNLAEFLEGANRTARKFIIY